MGQTIELFLSRINDASGLHRQLIHQEQGPDQFMEILSWVHEIGLREANLNSTTNV